MSRRPPDPFFCSASSKDPHIRACLAESVLPVAYFEVFVRASAFLVGLADGRRSEFFSLRVSEGALMAFAALWHLENQKRMTKP